MPSPLNGPAVGGWTSVSCVWSEPSRCSAHSVEPTPTYPPARSPPPPPHLPKPAATSFPLPIPWPRARAAPRRRKRVRVRTRSVKCAQNISDLRIVPNTDTLLAMASPLPRSSVPDSVFDWLREATLSVRYAPRERLPTQRALAADLGGTLASVREALGLLEQVRLVARRRRAAAHV